MEIYIFIGVFLLLITCIAPRDKTVFYFFCILFAMIGLFRSHNVGTDCIAYSSAFRKITLNPNTWNLILPFEPGFNVLCALFKQYISSSPMLWWGIMSAFYTFNMGRFFRKYTSNINIALLLFYLLGTYMFSFNIIRQSFAFALLLVSFSAMNIEELRKRDFFKCMLVIVVCAILFHSVMYALLVVPFVALYMKKWNISKRFLFFMLAMSFLAFYFNVAVNYVMGFVDQTGLEGKLINYAIRNAQIGEDSGYSILKVTFVSVWAAFLIKMCPVKTDLFLTLYIIGVVILNSFGNLVVEFARVYEIFNVFGIIYMARIWSMKRIGLQLYLYRIGVIIYSVVLFVNLLIKNYGEIVPYEFRF